MKNSQKFSNTTNNINKNIHYNNFQRTFTKNNDNNHYRTIEDLYKKSPPKAPVYYSKEGSKNYKVNNNHLNQILNKRNNFSDKIKLNENYSNYYAPNKYESDYTKNKNKYNISDAMNILLDKDNKY